jgi:hypothetical protein
MGRRTTVMSLIDAVAAIALLMDFLVGTAFGVFVTVCAALNREDKRYSLWGTPPDSASAGTRILVGVGFRGVPQGHSPRHPDQRLRRGRRPGK